jgi:hypothetical protein
MQKAIVLKQPTFTRSGREVNKAYVADFPMQLHDGFGFLKPGLIRLIFSDPDGLVCRDGEGCACKWECDPGRTSEIIALSYIHRYLSLKNK